jgi:hypothetical protein
MTLCCSDDSDGVLRIVDANQGGVVGNRSVRNVGSIADPKRATGDCVGSTNRSAHSSVSSPRTACVHPARQLHALASSYGQTGW